MADDAPRVRPMPGPVRPQYGELDAVVRAARARGAGAGELRALALEVAQEEDLDPRRALDRVEALLEEDA